MIDRKRYRLLLDLFDELADRREMLSQLGRDGVTLKMAAWLYFGLSALVSVLMVAAAPPLATFFTTFLGLTAFLLLSVLISETSNSLVNPVEGLVLAHQPINGATYTAAKLTHLLRILLYLVPGLNAAPALAGLLLKGAPWYYPIAHMLAAFAVGLVAALLCCAVFGWLIRFVPSARLKAAGQVAEMLPWIAFTVLQFRRGSLRQIRLPHWWPADAASRWWLGTALALAAGAIVAVGIRSLSGDYLIRVSSIVQGGSRRRSKGGRSRTGGLAARFFGGQAGRAGFTYAAHLMLRDWQFRRQLIPMLPTVIIAIGLVAGGARTSPFSGRFTALHVLPHLFGVILFAVCSVLAYGSDYKAIWLFQLVPNGAFRGFARGVHGLLWFAIIVVPHAILLVVLAWFWGIAQSGLFVAYSVAAGSTYLALELRLVEGVPFGRLVEASRGMIMLPLMMAGGLCMAIAVGLQYFLISRSAALVVVATVAIGGAAWFLTRRSLKAFEDSMRYQLGVLSEESKGIYREVA